MALESGEYKQGYGCLTKRMEDGELDCCLGVACKVAIQAGVDVVVAEPALGDNAVRYDGQTTFLPDHVRGWLGFMGVEGQYGPKEAEYLADDNDFKCRTFAEIAHIIRTEPGLYVDGE